MASYNVVTKWGANVYNFLNFTPPQDCCSGALGQALTIGEIRGKWIRYELVILNRGGPAFDEILYFKNITDNLPEVELWQLSMAGQLNDGTNLQPPGILNQLHSEMYRQGSCLGFGATSHFMIAGWDTDEGQRIGGAYEIEGAAGGAGGSGGDPSATSGATSTSATSGAGATTWGPGAAADESQSGGCACRLASPLPRHRWAGLALALALACAARRRYRAHGMRVTSG